LILPSQINCQKDFVRREKLKPPALLQTVPQRHHNIDAVIHPGKNVPDAVAGPEGNQPFY